MVRDRSGKKSRNHTATISRWKILDNLRRSLLAPAIVLLLTAGWTILPGSGIFVSLFVLLTLAFPVYAHLTGGLLIHPRGVPWTSHFWSVWGDFRTRTAQLCLEIVFIAHQSWLMADAIVAHASSQTCFATSPAGMGNCRPGSKNQTSTILRSFFRFMWPAEAICLVTVVLIIALKPRAVALCRAVSGDVDSVSANCLYVSRPRVERHDGCSARRTCGRPGLCARRTWRFFEDVRGLMKTTGCRRIIFRKTRRSSRIAPRPPTSDCCCSRL